MRFKPDIVITDEADVPIALVVVKVLAELDKEDVTGYMRGLLEYGPQPPVRYVLLITADTGYVWLSVDAVLREEAPEFTFPMARVIQRYFRAGDSNGFVSDTELELFAALWFWSIVDGRVADAAMPDNLRAAGFLDAGHGGDVRARVFA